MIKVSIIYYLKEISSKTEKFLENISYQTLKDIEIILLYKKENLPCKRFCKAFPNKIKAYEINGKTSDVLKFGISKAEGECIIFMYHYDLPVLDMCKNMYQKITEEESDAVSCDIQKIGSRYTLIKMPPFKTNILYDCLDNKMFKKEVFENIEEIEVEKTDSVILGYLLPKINKISKINMPLINVDFTTKEEENLEDIEKDLEKLYDKMCEKYPKEIEYIYFMTIYNYIDSKIKNKNLNKKDMQKAKELISSKFPNIKENEFIKKEAIQTNLNPFIMKVHHIFGGK